MHGTDRLQHQGETQARVDTKHHQGARPFEGQHEVLPQRAGAAMQRQGGPGIGLAADPTVGTEIPIPELLGPEPLVPPVPIHRLAPHPIADDLAAVKDIKAMPGLDPRLAAQVDDHHLQVADLGAAIEHGDDLALAPGRSRPGREIQQGLVAAGHHQPIARGNLLAHALDPQDRRVSGPLQSDLGHRTSLVTQDVAGGRITVGPAGAHQAIRPALPAIQTAHIDPVAGPPHDPPLGEGDHIRRLLDLVPVEDVGILQEGPDGAQGDARLRGLQGCDPGLGGQLEGRQRLGHRRTARRHGRTWGGSRPWPRHGTRQGLALGQGQLDHRAQHQAPGQTLAPGRRPDANPFTDTGNRQGIGLERRRGRPHHRPRRRPA